MATCGWPVKSGVEATNATTLTTRLTADEVADLGLDRGERVERALLRALVRPPPRLTSPPTLPVAISSPVAHRQLAGGEDVVAAAHGRDVGRHRLGHLGHASGPSSASRSSGVLIVRPRAGA